MVITLSVVVPATDTPETLGRCTAAISAAAAPPDEVIVVDEPVTLSATAARNAGVRQATGEVIVFVDADVEVHPDVFTRIRAAFDTHPLLTAVYGSYDDAPAVATTVSAFRNLLHHHVHSGGAGPAETFWTGLGAVRRDRFLGVGGFDEDRYPHPSIEDIELGRRLILAGGEIHLDPTIQGTHLKRWTMRGMLWTDFARRGVPWTALQIRERRASSTLNLGWRHRLSALSCLLVLVGAASAQPFLALGALANLVALNHAFYRLLVARLGLVRAVAGIGLHGIHHLTAIAAVGSAIVLVGAQALVESGRISVPRGAGAVPGEQLAP